MPTFFQVDRSMDAPDYKQLANMATPDRHRFLRENYGVLDGTMLSDDPCTFLSRLGDHLGTLSALAAIKGTFSSAQLQQNDQFVCAEICVSKLLRFSKWKNLAPIEIEMVDSLWEKFVCLHKILASEAKPRDESDVLHLMYFTSCVLKAIMNCDGRERIIIDELLVAQLKRIGVGQFLGQKPDALAVRQLAKLLDVLIADH